MDDRYADDEYRSSYPGGLPEGEYQPEGAYDEHASGQYAAFPDDGHVGDPSVDAYATGEYGAGQDWSGAYDAPGHEAGQYETGGYPSGQYPEYQEYADQPPAYGYDDTPPTAEPEQPSLIPRPRIEPIDEDGVRAAEIGALVWLVAFVGLLPFWGPLRSHGNTWLIWMCLAGFGLGAIGMEITRRRRARRAAGEEL